MVCNCSLCQLHVVLLLFYFCFACYFGRQRNEEEGQGDRKTPLRDIKKKKRTEKKEEEESKKKKRKVEDKSDDEWTPSKW